MTPDQFTHLHAKAIDLHDQQPLECRRVSLDAIFVALVLADAAGERVARKSDTRMDDQPPIIDERVRGVLGTLKGHRLPLPNIMMRCGLWPTTMKRTRQFARELREGGFKSARYGGEVVFHL